MASPWRAYDSDVARWQEAMELDDLDGRRADVNPKGHDGAGIAASVSRFGYIEPIVLDERTGKLIGGHGRLDDLVARRAAGVDPPEGVEIDESGAWRIPVDRGWSSADDAEATAAAVALNRLVERGGWDERTLLEQLEPFRVNGGLQGTGFSGDDLDVLLRRFEATSAPPTDPNAEWVGMPEFASDSKRAAASVAIHFPTEEDAVAFFALIGRDRTRSLWWPKADGHVGSSVKVEFVADPT